MPSSRTVQRTNLPTADRPLDRRAHPFAATRPVRSRVWARLCALCTLTALAGCVYLDRFSNRATEFNVQVADSQNKTLLLNIVRAANRFPMHFTELSTLSGTGSLSAGGTLNFPFASFHGGNDVFKAGPTAMVTESPTFNVAVLETQEFYQGMLRPISQEQLSSYLQEGLQPELIYVLAFGEILYQRAPTSAFDRIENNFHPLKHTNVPLCPPAPLAKDGKPEPIGEYSCFKEVLRALIERRLTTEQIQKATNLGPLLPAKAFDDLKWMNGLDPKTVKIASVEADDCKKKTDTCPEGFEGLPKEQQEILTAGQRLFRVYKESDDYRFCFDQNLSEAAHPDPKRTFDGEVARRIATEPLSPALLCHDRLPEGYKPPKESHGSKGSFSLRFGDPAKPQEGFGLQFQPRSTEGVIYYLGEISRCQIGLDPLSVCSVPPAIYVDYRKAATPPQDPEDKVFVITRQKASGSISGESRDSAIEVDWAGWRYRVAMDPRAVDRSGQVLRILTQLLALNRSAKDFPTPAVVPIISR